MYIDKLDHIVNKFIKSYMKLTNHSTIKIKPVNVKSSAYIDSNRETSDKDPKFRIADIVRISKY